MTNNKRGDIQPIHPFDCYYDEKYQQIVKVKNYPGGGYVILGQDGFPLETCIRTEMKLEDYKAQYPEQYKKYMDSQSLKV